MIEFTIKTNVLYELFKKAKPFLEKTDARPILQGICCHVYDDAMRAIASDGNVVIDAVFPISSKGDKGKFVLPYIDGFNKSKLPWDSTIVTVGEKDISIVNSVASRTVRQFVGEYPNFLGESFNVFPEYPITTLGFDPRLLKTALNAFNEKAVELDIFNDKRGGVTIKGENMRAFVLPVRIREEARKEFYNGMAEI